MNGFRRGISESTLNKLANGGLDECRWLADLLTLWSPSGTSSEKDGLRLSIHGGQVDFYHHGSLITKVTFPQGKPRGCVACAFVEDEGKGVLRWGGNDGTASEPRGYLGVDTLREWMVRARKYHYAHMEKSCVDAIVAENPGVLELEMGLTGYRADMRDAHSAVSESVGAPRIDIVAVEPHDGGFQLVFWEIKLHGDKRMVSSGERVEVIEQLKRFETWLDDNDRCETILASYQRAWRQLAELSRLANEQKAKRGLPLIRENPWVDHPPESLKRVDPVPRLVVAEWKKAGRNANWDEHLKKLGEYPCIELPRENSMRLYAPGQYGTPVAKPGS